MAHLHWNLAPPRGRDGVLASCLVLLIVAGCGTGEYESRLANRAAHVQNTLNFNELYAPQPLPNTPISVRVPTLFTESPLIEGAPDKSGNPVDLRRVTPTLFALPWLKLTYEGFIDNPEGGKLPYYCYVAAVDKATLGGENLEAAWNAALAAKGGTLDPWTDFQGKTPEGGTVDWKKLRFAGQQEFYTIGGNGQEQFVQLPGVLDVYLREQNGFYVLIAWRMPASIEPQVDSAKWASMMTGCVGASQ